MEARFLLKACDMDGQMHGFAHQMGGFAHHVERKGLVLLIDWRQARKEVCVNSVWSRD